MAGARTFKITYFIKMSNKSSSSFMGGIPSVSKFWGWSTMLKKKSNSETVELFLWMGMFENYGATSWFYNSITSHVRSGGEVRYSILVIISFRLPSHQENDWSLYSVNDVTIAWGRCSFFQVEIIGTIAIYPNSTYRLQTVDTWYTWPPCEHPWLCLYHWKVHMLEKNTTLCHRLQQTFRMFSGQLKGSI